jgi:hypothetical protein
VAIALVAFIGLASRRTIALAAPPALTLPSQLAWGHLRLETNNTGRIALDILNWPDDGKLVLPTPFPNLTTAHLDTGNQLQPLSWLFNADATQFHIELPVRTNANLPLESN